MLRTTKRLSSTLVHSPRSPMSFFRTILHIVRTALNRVRWEENQQFTALEQRSSTVPKNAEQATQLFLATEKQIALSEEGRLQRIDQILGTKTYFHEGKVYHQRIDSDHLMQIEQLKRENPETKREHLNWLNPQSDIKLKYKNKRNYLNLVSKLCTYPSHQPGTYNLDNETDEYTIAFLATETAYSTITLKPIELTAESLEQQSLLLPPEPPFESQRFSYFRPQFSMQLLRVPKTLYTSELLQDPSAIDALGSQVEEVISLDEIYQALKEFDTDERVHEYLRKIENNRMEYLFTELSFDTSENTVALTIDILDNGIEHCLLVKSLVSKQAILKPIFNMKPPVCFSSDGKTVFYIQRSGEGGWIQLVKRPVQNCWAGSELMIMEEDEGIIFRASPEKELKLGKDTNSNFVFLTISDYGKKYSESLFVISSRDSSIDLLSVDEDRKCEYFYDMSPMGLIYGKKRKVESGSLKYGNNKFYIESLQLIPFKQHIQLTTEKLGLTQLPGHTSQPIPPGPEELDFQNKRCIFIPEKHQFITEIEIRRSHIMMVLNYTSLYDRATLYLLPLKSNAHPHSLILTGGPKLRLRKNTYNYDSQEVEFTQPQGPIRLEKVYNIWKKELRHNERQASKYHYEVLSVEDHSHPFELYFVCKQLYLEEKDLPVVLMLTEKGEQIDQQILRQFLEKGVGVIHFCGRGTFSKDLEHFLGGSRHNFGNMLDDLKAAIQFVGNRMTTNISLYCKGQVSSLAGLWFNIYFPYLFNASILHNGLYDLSDHTELANCADFLGSLTQANQLAGFDLKKFNFFQHKFKTLTRKTDEDQQIEIGYLENIIISSDPLHRLHSRKLIKRLRENDLLRYDTVFLKEYEDPYSTDLHNLSFLYAKIRDRLERELNEMPEDSEDN